MEASIGRPDLSLDLAAAHAEMAAHASRLRSVGHQLEDLALLLGQSKMSPRPWWCRRLLQIDPGTAGQGRVDRDGPAAHLLERLGELGPANRLEDAPRRTPLDDQPGET